MKMSIAAEASWQNEKSYINETKNEKGNTVYYGYYYYNYTCFSFTLTEQNSGRYAFRGQIKAETKTGITFSKTDKSSEKKQDIKSSIHIDFNSIEGIKEIIAKKAAKLYSENMTLIISDLKHSTNPENISLGEAAEINAEMFVKSFHAKAFSSNRQHYEKHLKEICAKFGHTPMSLISTTKAKKVLKTNQLPNNDVEELYAFWNFCVDRNVCFSQNPFTKPSKATKGTEVSKQKKLNELSQLELEKQNELYDKLEQNTHGISVGIALLSSGIPSSMIENIKIGDLVFNSEDDFIVIKLLNPSQASATKNISRPLVPRAAIVVQKYIDTLMKRYPLEELSYFPLCGLIEDPNKSITKKRLIDEATREVRSLFSSADDLPNINKLNPSMSSVQIVLGNTYKNNLLTYCNLDENSLEYKFLVARSLQQDVTLDHYTSLACPPGWRKLYVLLKPLKKEIPLEKKVDIITDTKSTIHSTPDISLEYAKQHITAIIKPGGKLKCTCENGMFLSVKAHKLKGDHI